MTLLEKKRYIKMTTCTRAFKNGVLFFHSIVIHFRSQFTLPPVTDNKHHSLPPTFCACLVNATKVFLFSLLNTNKKVSLFTMRQNGERRTRKKKEMGCGKQNKCGLCVGNEGEIDGMMAWDEKEGRGEWEKEGTEKGQSE
jgi:hypothetical protein